MRILVVEDEAKIAKFIRKGFETHQVAVDLAGDGEEGLFKATISEYDAVLLDVGLPKMNGVEVCQRLRVKGIKTPIVMVTGHDELEDKILGLDMGADDYLTKPFSFQELFARVRSVVRRKDHHIKPHIRLYDLVIDTNKCLVLRGSKIVDLSPLKYRLLEFLVKNRGKLLSRYDIMENVWGSGELILTNVVEVHVSALRRELNRGGKKNLIHTIRGEGYILE
jgi:DNA-binding response OmpR family regulator